VTFFFRVLSSAQPGDLIGDLHHCPHLLHIVYAHDVGTVQNSSRNSRGGSEESLNVARLIKERLARGANQQWVSKFREP
jgi:hypothetical protein